MKIIETPIKSRVKNIVSRKLKRCNALSLSNESVDSRPPTRKPQIAPKKASAEVGYGKAISSIFSLTGNH